ncbi:MAG: Rpn family recombination-promoting nuclease/putative transposase [Phormidesmis sp.]
MPTDHIFHALFMTAPGLVLKLIGKQPTATYKFSSVEVKETAFRFDGVLTPAAESADQPTVFVEVQFQKDVRFYRRLFAEIFIFLRHNPNVAHWQALVIFERRSREPDQHQRLPFQTLLQSPQLHVIYLEDFQQASADSWEAAILQLIVTNPREAIQRAKVLISRIKSQTYSNVSESQILELVETIVVYKFPNLEREVIATMLELYSMKETRVYQDALAEGRQEGRQEGQCRVIVRQLVRKFGELPQTTADKVEMLSNEQLDELGDRLLDLSTPEELTDCLDSL